MKTSIQHTLAALAILTAAALGQGVLAPAGAPAPTMKSLLELWNKVHGVELQVTDIQTAVTGIQADAATIKTTATGIQTAVDAIRDDARNPISSTLAIVGLPGSYYLTKNLTVASGEAIIVAADDVTIDLNGFTISSTHASGSGSAILLSGTRKNIHIKNGSIKGTTNFSGGVFTGGGFNNGIFGDFCENVTVSDIRVRNVAAKGINLSNFDNNGIIVDRSSVFMCGSRGIVAETVRGCTANYCGELGILGNTVSDSTAISVGLLSDDYGIYASAVSNSNGSAKGGGGIYAISVTNSRGYTIAGIGIAGGNIANSYGATANGLYGIEAEGTASYCRGENSGGIGIKAAIAIGCTVGSGETVSSPSKHLGTP